MHITSLVQVALQPALPDGPLPRGPGPHDRPGAGMGPPRGRVPAPQAWGPGLQERPPGTCVGTGAGTILL